MTDAKADNVVAAILLSLFAILLFDFMGLVIKRISADFTAAELSAWRNVIGLIPSMIALYLSSAWIKAGKPWRVRQTKLALFRGVILTIAQLAFYIGLARMAFATVNTISYANALFMVALAVPLLGERVGIARWSAVLVGFVGVVLVMRPGAGTFSTDAIFPLIAAFCYALAGVTARLFDEDVPTPLINLYSSATAALGAVVVAFFFGGFTAPDLTQFLWICAMGFFGGCAVLCLMVAYRMTEQSNLAPFNYFGIPMAFVLGWFFFDEAPWDELFPGALLIIASGLIIVWRERMLKTRTAAATIQK